MKLMWKRTKPPVGTTVQDLTEQAEHLARIPGQHRLANPHTNPAVRPHADRLRNVEHVKVLDSGHSRVLRRIRVEDRRAEHAEKALEALHEAREVSSAAKSVLALYAGRARYMRISLATSIVLAFGSARGLEQLADTHPHVPAGSGYIAEVGLTGLATIVILARSDLTQHGGKIKGWHDAVLWSLMIAPLMASMVANVYGKNVIGAVCAAGAAAFSLFSYVIAEAFASSAKDQSKKVTGDDESKLRRIAAGEALLSVPTPPLAGGHNDGEHSDGGHKELTGPVPMALPEGDHKLVPTSKPTPVPTVEQKPSDHPAPVTTGEHKPVTTPVPTPEPTAEVPTPEPMATATAMTTTAPSKPPQTPPAKRRTRDQIRAELQKALKEHYDNGGGEPEVKPLAEAINANRRIVRELLAEMNVRPIRKAANQ